MARDESLREGAQIIEEMLRFPLPVIAAVNGPAVGLGCSIAVLCDIVLMSETAYLADPHVAVGTGRRGRRRRVLAAADPDPALSRVPLHRRPDPGRHGRRARARHAHRRRRTTCSPRPGALAERLAAQPLAALQGTKRVLNMHLAQALSGAMQAGFAAEAVTMQSDEHRERLLALRRSAP